MRRGALPTQPSTTTTQEVKPDREYTELYRLVSDEGMALTDGEHFAACADTENPDVWFEVEETSDPDFQDYIE